MQVVRHSDSKSANMYKTGEASAVLYKEASCQATLDLHCEVIVPLMFCTMFSPSCEASLQVDLPLKPSISLSISAPTSIPPLDIPSKISEKIPQGHTLLRKKRKGLSKSKAIEELGTEVYREGWDAVNPEQVHSDSQELGYASSPPPDCIDKDQDDSECSSDNDDAFWKKVERYSAEKMRTSSAFQFPLKYPRNKRGLKDDKSKSNSQSSQIPSRKCEGHEATFSREDDMKLADDDWITDDEVDEVDEDISKAFKKEFKERRVPPNTREKNYVCELCGKLYSKHSILRQHVVRDHKEDGVKLFPYFCQHCELVYVKESHLVKHQLKHRGPCEVCGVILKCSSQFWSHRRDHDSVCEVCNKAFTKRSKLDKHMRRVHQDTHMKKVSQGRKVPCPECDKTFTFECLKNKHIAKAHPTISLPYKCDKCDFWATKEVSIKLHQIKSHNANRATYTCKECKSKFTCEASYNTHLQNHISRSSIVCHLCSQALTSEEDFQAHMESFHETSVSRNAVENTNSSPVYSSEFQYSCAICNISLSDNEQLTQHMQQCHYMDIETPRDIKVEIEPVEAAVSSKGSANVLQTVNNGDSVPQTCDRPIKKESTTLQFSAGFDCSDGGSALLMPANVVPPNVNMVDINGVQYHVIRGNK